MRAVSMWIIALGLAAAQDLPSGLPEIRYQLTARPWKPLATPRGAYLDAIEGLCRAAALHQNAQGAVIDPYLKTEHQYSTPYFAYAAGVLLSAGRARDLLPHGVRAMDHATRCVAGGRRAIPDDHGEFFLAPLVSALELYRPHVPAETLEGWRSRLRLPLGEIIRGGTGNWRTYAMKGEWMRVLAGLAPPRPALDFIASSWYETQRNRILPDKWNLYHDRSSDPESHAVEAVGRGNLLALIAEHYDGPYSAEIAAAVERAGRAALLFQDPTGECPANGRTDNHVFNDVLYQLIFEVLAERALERGDARLAGQYRRAALLSFHSIARWRRADDPWTGSYYVTKNRFDPAQRVGYQPASAWSNYNGAVMMHLAEAWMARRSEIPERPAPAEIGGYAVSTDWNFASAFLNAGGMQVMANLRGDSVGRYQKYWAALGVMRFARAGWDTRLGPGDGHRDWDSKAGVSFAPTWRENGEWVRLASVPERYRGHLDATFAHPLLVRCRIEYRPVEPGSGPSFQQEFVVTPDGVLVTQRCYGSAECGVTLPLLENDGQPLETSVRGRIASTRYPGGGRQQSFLALDAAARLDASEEPLQSTYGWLRPVRLTNGARTARVFVYPGGGDGPAAEAVLESFRFGNGGFRSVLGEVRGNLYLGGHAAGGEGRAIDLDNDGQADAVFEVSTGFLLQLENRKVTAAETALDTAAVIHGRRVELRAHHPLRMR